MASGNRRRLRHLPRLQVAWLEGEEFGGADGGVRHRARTPLGSYNVARGGGAVLTPSLGSGELTVLDATGRVRWSLGVADAAHDACVI